MPNLFIRDYVWAQSKPRSIDDETLCDLLRIIEYQAERGNILDDIGMQDHGAPDEALFVFVLDALGVPSEDERKQFQGEHEAFKKELIFSREWFNQLFYSEFLLENEKHNWSHEDILRRIREELKTNLSTHYK